MTEKELYNQLEEYDKEVIKLFKENKKLKEDFNAIKQFQLKALEEHNKLQQRIDKAIEYIDNTNLQLPLEYGDKTAMFKRHLRTILKGEK